MKHASVIIILCISTALTPWLEDLLKVYIIAMIAVITLTVNVLFRIASLRDWIVEHLVQAVLARLLEDEEMKKIVKMKYDSMMIQLKTHNNEK